MKPTIIKTRFGGITLDVGGKEVEYQHDILIRLDGKPRKRKKKLSKQVYGTSHKISLAEAEHVYQEGAALLLVGTGSFGLTKLSPEAVVFFRDKGVRVQLRPTPKAARDWNALQGQAIGLFHVNC